MKQICHLVGLGIAPPQVPDLVSKRCRVVLRLDEHQDPVDNIDIDPEEDQPATVGGSAAVALVLSDQETLAGLAERETRVLWAGDLDPVRAWIALSDALAKMPGMAPRDAEIIELAVRRMRGRRSV